MISLGGLMGSSVKLGNMDVKLGQVVSNPFAKAFIKEAEGEDHEVSMANNSLDTIIKMATELKAKMGENEKDIPAWIQDHITNAENFISQASSNYHEYGQNEARIAEDKGPCWKGYQQIGMKEKNGKQVPNCVPNESVVREAKYNFGKDSAPGEWVAYLSMTRGKKLLKTFNTARGAKQYLSKNVDKLLSGANVESVGIMTKKQWDDREAKYAIEGVNEISSRTPKIFVKTAAVEKKIKELMADRKKAVVPYNSETDPAKKEKLKQVLIKLTNQIKGYEKNLIQLRDKEEEYLQQLHADAELDTTGL